jgi:hypothetical protein
MLIKYNGLRTTKHCMVNLALLQSHYTATANRHLLPMKNAPVAEPKGQGSVRQRYGSPKAQK